MLMMSTNPFYLDCEIHGPSAPIGQGFRSLGGGAIWSYIVNAYDVLKMPFSTDTDKNSLHILKKKIILSSFIIFHVTYMYEKAYKTRVMTEGGSGDLNTYYFILLLNLNERNQWIHIFKIEKEWRCVLKLRYCKTIWKEFSRKGCYS